MKNKNLSNEEIERMENEADNFQPAEVGFPKFWDFHQNKTFVGILVEEYEYNPEKGEPITGYIFKDKQGFKWLIGKNYQIEQAIEKYGVKKYKIEFTGTKKLDGGRKVNEFQIAFTEPI